MHSHLCPILDYNIQDYTFKCYAKNNGPIHFPWDTKMQSFYAKSHWLTKKKKLIFLQNTKLQSAIYQHDHDNSITNKKNIKYILVNCPLNLKRIVWSFKDNSIVNNTTSYLMLCFVHQEQGQKKNHKFKIKQLALCFILINHIIHQLKQLQHA